MTEKTTIVQMIAHALAGADGVEPTSLGYMLAEYIDLGGLETIVSMENSSGAFTSQVPDHEVTVTAAGVVFVDGKRYQGQHDTLDTQTSGMRSSLAASPQFRSLVDTLPGMVYQCRNQQGWPMDFVSEGSSELTATTQRSS